VLASLYAATAFIKHSKHVNNETRQSLVYWIRHTVFEIINDENLIIKNKLIGLDT